MPITTTGIATSFIQYSRPGATGGGATVTDSDGKIKWAGHNLLTNSESFNESAWVKNASGTTTPVITANVATAPDGTTTADKVDFGAIDAAADYSIIYQAHTSSDASYTGAVFIKAAAAGDVGKKVWLYQYDTAFKGVVALTLTADWQLATSAATLTSGSNRRFAISTIGSDIGGENQGAVSAYLWGAHLYRSDLGGMVINPARGDAYYPTTPKNLLGYTEDFSNAAWTKSNTTVGPIAIAAPNGLVVADKLEASANASVSGQQVYQALTTLGPGNYVYTIYAKKGSGATDANKFAVRDNTTPTNLAVLSIDYDTGVITQTTGSGATSTDVGNGWWRIAIPFTISTAVGNSIRFNAGSTGSTEAVGEFCYVWGAQVSDSGSIDPYSPVYGAAVTSAAYYAPRLDYDPVILSPKGFLVESQVANLLLQSADFTTTWTTLTATVSANSTATTAPDGTTTSDKVIADNTAALDSSGVTQTITTAAATYTFSAYVKAAEYNRVRLLVRDDANAANAADVTVSLVDGTTAIAAANAGTFTGASVATVAAGNNWYRVALTFTSTGATALRARVLLSDSVSTTGNGTSGIYVYGAQLEALPFATSYIPTGSASATRIADISGVNTQSFPYSTTEGSWVVAFQTLYSAGAPTNSYILNVDGSLSKRIAYISSGAQNLYSFDGSTVLQAVGDITGSVSKIASAYNASNRYVVSNGGTVASGTIAAGYSTASVVYIGNTTATTGLLNGHFRQITYLPRRLSDSELQTRTA